MKVAPVRVLLLSLVFAILSNAALVSRQIPLGANEYFLPPEAAFSLAPWTSDLVNSTDEFVPLTVVSFSATRATEVNLRAAFESFNQTDDVWNSDFTQHLLIFPGNDAIQLPDCPAMQSALLPEYSVDSILTGHSTTPNITQPPQGPYFLNVPTRKVYRAYKLVSDTNQAFIQSSYQDDNDVHHTLAAGITSAAGLTIALPSRLWYTQTPDKPLAGLRLAVKDLYHLNGMKTSFGNRAMFEMSEPENTTAVAVQKLIDAGAVVVGKNKLSEFAYAGSYVVDHIDYLLPFNPRGDGYNSPGDSSGGSGSAVASYDWLDASMGSDTGGSIRGPALVNGVMGNRPSTGAVDLSGALPLSKAMDTSGLLVRDPMLWSRMNKVLYSGFGKEYPSLPKKVYVDPSLISDDPSYTTWWQQDVQPVIKAISAFLGTNVSSVSIDQIWNSTNHPGKLNRTEIANVVNVVYGNVNAYEQWTMFGRDYVNAWMETHDGEFPHMSPSTRRGWLAANTSITADMHQNYLDDMQIVRQWVADKFLKPDNDSCSDAIYLYFEPPFKQYKLDVSAATEDPYIEQLVEQATRLTIQVAELNATLLCDTTSASSNTTASTACREAQENFEALASGASDPVTVSPGRLASVAGLPDFAIAMGASPVFSNSTLKEEMVPWGMDIMAARGCDFMIQDLISALAQQGIVKTVTAGAQAF